MSVITISRETGSEGTEIALEVAKKLDLECVDKQLIVKVARKAKVSKEKVEKFDQEEYSPASQFLSRFLLSQPSLYSSSSFPEIAPLGVVDVYTGYEFFDTERYLELTQAVIRKLAEKGNVVILGRGSQVILKDHPDTLHVRITAPLELRIARVMGKQKLSEREAKELILKRDRAAARYLKDFYRVDWQDPLLYHLVINTGLMSRKVAVKTICEAASGL